MDTLKMHSPNLTDANVAKIRELFPSCVTEAKDEQGSVRLVVDFDQLKQELSDHIVEGSQERYHLNWPGKREALFTANVPIAKTLRPAREESVNFSATKNLFIEGDNLEALKLLQETYLGAIKLIYIDPPYNTGNDLVYQDDFSERADEFLKRSNQKDEQGARLVANPQSMGRFHSEWLSMMYPRLRLSKNLLAENGLIIISIDDGEVAALRLLCDEIFGREGFVAQFCWKSRVSEDTRAKSGVSTDHEYLVCYSRADIATFRGVEKDLDKFSNNDNDPRGPWRSADLTGLATKDARPNLHYDLIDPSTGTNYGCPPKGWRYEPATMHQKIAEGRILFPQNSDGRPRHKLFLREMNSLFKSISSVITAFSTAEGTRELNALMGGVVFSFPKPTALIRTLIEQASSDGDVVMDYFAGSGTTADAVMQQSARDGLNRRFIAVQFPEALTGSVQREAAQMCKALGVQPYISELTKERLRRAGKKLDQEPHPNWNRDVGFRVLKIDTSNMADVYYTPDAVKQTDLLGAVDNIKPGRDNPEDLLFQVLVDWGVDLALPIRKETVKDKTVFFVNVEPYDLIACFDKGVSEDLVKELAKHKPMRVVFRDNGFESDAVKINVDQIFRQLSPSTDVKSI